MTNRRDLLLQQMDIPQWQLHRPEVFQGVVKITIAHNIRLVIVSDQTIEKSAVLLQDILRAINIPAQDCLFLEFEQFTHLTMQTNLCYWFLTDDRSHIEQIICEQGYQVWHSPSWQTFRHDPLAKRQLWQMIYQRLTDDEHE